jgi:hypothetical protein
MILDNRLISKPANDLAVHTEFIFPSQGLHCHAKLPCVKRRPHSDFGGLFNMRRKLTWAVLCIAGVGFVALYNAGSARATQASGFSGQNLIPFTATFQGFQVFNHLTQDQLQQLAPGFPNATWTSFQKTEGPSDLYLQSNTWQIGGSTGWHRHPGHSLIVITSGQVTQYHADCTSEVYGPGTANGPTLVDSGNDEHLIRNEGGIIATGFAVQLVASGAPRRIDVPIAPATCPIL